MIVEVLRSVNRVYIALVDLILIRYSRVAHVVLGVVRSRRHRRRLVPFYVVVRNVDHSLVVVLRDFQRRRRLRPPISIPRQRLVEIAAPPADSDNGRVEVNVVDVRPVRHLPRTPLIRAVLIRALLDQAGGSVLGREVSGFCVFRRRVVVDVLVDVAGLRVVHGGDAGFGVVGPRCVLVVRAGRRRGRLELVLDLLEDFRRGAEAGLDASDAGAPVEAVVVVFVVVFVVDVGLIPDKEKIC